LKISEKQRQGAFALLALAAIAAAAYVVFLGPADNPSDGSEFYYLLKGSDRVGLLYDARGASQAQTTAIYQCGVDMISKGRFVGKTIENIACDDSGCLSASTASNGTSTLTYEQAAKKVSAMPYIIVKAGNASSSMFFQRHMEIVIGTNLGNSSSKCDIAAVES
jgi:hypothetical protein